MRLLFVHERFGALGGAEANARITASEFKRRGHAIGIIHGPGTRRDEPAWEQTFESCYPLFGREPKSVIAQAAAEFRPDLFYVHKMADLGVIESLLATGIPLVRMVHDHDIYCMRSYRYGVLSRKICRRPVSAHCVFACGAFVTRDRQGLLPLKWVSYRAKQREVALNKRFDRMIVVTEYMKQELLLNGFQEKRIVIHAPAPLAGDATVRSSFSDRNLILYAGQIIRGKGVDVLIQALAHVQMPFECLIVGDGSHRKHCEKLCRKLGLLDRVHFRGFVPQDELKQHYRECSVVAVSSVWPEPIATIGLEVMRYALPVVAFDAGGIKDWLIDGYNGFLVPWMDRVAFARRLDQILADKSLARTMGLHGLRLVTENYDFDTYIAALESMFAELVAEKQRPRGASAAERSNAAQAKRDSLMARVGI